MSEKLFEDLLSNSSNLEVIVDSELMSKGLKNKLLKHKAVVSERDVSTLDYNLSKLAVQEQGLKIVDDFYYPYLNLDKYDSFMVERALGLVRFFHEIYSDSEVLSAIREYLLQNDDFEATKELFNLSLKLIVNSGKDNKIPRSFTRLLLKDLKIKTNNAFIKSDLIDMPQSFLEQINDSGALVYGVEPLEWSNELDLYDSNLANLIDFQNFSDPVNETRWALEMLSKDPALNVYYPPNVGYESLLFIYQKEFFSDQVVFYENPENKELRGLINHMQIKTASLRSKYQKSIKTNKISFNEKEAIAMNLESYLDEYLLKTKVSDRTLNFFSDIITNFDDSFKFEPELWFKLIEKKNFIDSAKKNNLKTNLNIFKYDEPSFNSNKSSIVIGWGNEIFNRKVKTWLPLQFANKLQNDLGVNSKALFKTQAHDLLKNLQSTSSEIIATYSKINLNGDSRHQGLLKTLKDKKNEQKVVRRSYHSSVEIKKPKFIKKKEPIKLSASSLNRYYQCPYKYYLEKNVGLSKEQDEDYFISPRDEGSLMHKALEDLSPNQKPDLNKFSEVVKKYFQNQTDFETWRDVQTDIIIDKLWPFYKSEYEYLVTNKIKPRFTEKSFNFYYNPLSKEFSQTTEDGSIWIRGAVDRIDEDEQGNLILYDYKRAGTGAYVVSTYKESSPLNPQAFIYYMAATLGCFGSYENIVGFQFVNLTEMKREKGFLFKDLYKETSLVKEKSGLIEKVKFDEKLNLFKKRLIEITNDIILEKFEPKPIKSDECLSCDWRGVCKKTPSFI